MHIHAREYSVQFVPKILLRSGLFRQHTQPMGRVDYKKTSLHKDVCIAFAELGIYCKF